MTDLLHRLFSSQLMWISACLSSSAAKYMNVVLIDQSAKALVGICAMMPRSRADGVCV